MCKTCIPIDGLSFPVSLVGYWETLINGVVGLILTYHLNTFRLKNSVNHLASKYNLHRKYQLIALLCNLNNWWYTSNNRWKRSREYDDHRRFTPEYLKEIFRYRNISPISIMHWGDTHKYISIKLSVTSETLDQSKHLTIANYWWKKNQPTLRWQIAVDE